MTRWARRSPWPGEHRVFSSVGWGEIVVLLLAALFIFGPERLPDVAKDAAAGLRRARTAMTGARAGLHETLGPDFDDLRDVDLRQYHPKALIRRALLEEPEEPTSGPVPPLAAERGRVMGSRDGTPEPHGSGGPASGLG
jgi:sec-independent protein translocase protein TatB